MTGIVAVTLSQLVGVWLYFTGNNTSVLRPQLRCSQVVHCYLACNNLELVDFFGSSLCIIPKIGYGLISMLPTIPFQFHSNSKQEMTISGRTCQDTSVWTTPGGTVDYHILFVMEWCAAWKLPKYSTSIRPYRTAGLVELISSCSM